MVPVTKINLFEVKSASSNTWIQGHKTIRRSRVGGEAGGFDGSPDTEPRTWTTGTELNLVVFLLFLRHSAERIGGSPAGVGITGGALAVTGGGAGGVSVVLEVVLVTGGGVGVSDPQARPALPDQGYFPC